MLNLPLSHIEVKFILDGQTYEVESFNIKFTQPVDFKGQPQHEVLGGQLMLVLTQVANSDFYLWAKKGTMLKNGEVLFQTDLGMTLLRVCFTNAYCTTLVRNINAMTGTKTKLVISSEKIKINGVEHDNFWPSK
jgi:hypothetical protein